MKSHLSRLEEFTCTLSLRDLSEAFEDISPNALWVCDSTIWQAFTSPAAPAALRRAMWFLSEEAANLAAVAPAAPHPVNFKPSRRVVIVPPGEKAKNWDHVAAVLERGFELGLARDSTIVGLGGGIVCDMTAFAASVYMRGSKLVLLPTTLLGMVDAAFGGKNGINFGGYKNMVGTFYPAHEVRVCPGFLATLPEKEYICGLAEVIKHAYLGDEALYKKLTADKVRVLSRDASVLGDLVWESLLVKARHVEADLRETGIRAHLNLGHTFGHALEAVAGFEWSHGEAVAWGMVRAVLLSSRLGHCSPSYASEVRALIESYGYRTKAPDAPIDALIKAMLMDKKKKGGAVRFVLQRGFGDTFQSPVDEKDLRAVLTAD